MGTMITLRGGHGPMPKKPYPHLGKRVRNHWTKTDGYIFKAEWVQADRYNYSGRMGYCWHLTIRYDDGHEMTWCNPSDFWEHHGTLGWAKKRRIRTVRGWRTDEWCDYEEKKEESE